MTNTQIPNASGDKPSSDTNRGSAVKTWGLGLPIGLALGPGVGAALGNVGIGVAIGCGVGIGLGTLVGLINSKD